MLIHFVDVFYVLRMAAYEIFLVYGRFEITEFS